MVRYLNCQLSNVSDNAADLMDFEIQNSQLVNLSFSGSNVYRFKNSKLKNIEFNKMTVQINIFKNGVFTLKEILIQDYSSFLKECVEINQDKSNFTDNKVLNQIMIFFTFLTFLVYLILNPILFHLIWKY